MRFELEARRSLAPSIEYAARDGDGLVQGDRPAEHQDLTGTELELQLLSRQWLHLAFEVSSLAPERVLEYT